jgi:hypothetical protein
MAPIPNPAAVCSSWAESGFQPQPIDTAKCKQMRGCSMATRSHLAKFRGCFKNSYFVTISGKGYSSCEAAETSSDNDDIQLDWL